MPYKHQDLLTSTYFDDFDATKNFLQVLFKPGYAVQARELTQLQTILQNQISKVGDHLFLDGTHVYGAKISTGYYYYFARIANVKYVGQTATIPTASQVASMFKNKSFCPVKFKSKSGTAYDTTSATDRSAIANLDPDIDIIIEVVDVLEPTTNDGYILIFKFNKGSFKSLDENEAIGIDLTNSTTNPLVFEEITDSSKTKLFAFLNTTNTNATPIRFEFISKVKNGTQLILENCNSALSVNISEGIFYKDGRFIQTPSTFLIPNKISTYDSTTSTSEIEQSMYDSGIRATGNFSGRRLFTYQSKKIGFKIEFTGITSNDDSTLFDNAQNYPNYNAPGADRLKAIITAISEEFDPTSVESYKSKTSDGKDFIELVRFKKGVIQSIKKDTEYNEILGLFAGRTYDESGSYTVNPFKLEIKEHLKRDLFKINLTSFSTTPEVGDMVFKTSDATSLTNLVFLSQTPTGSQFYPNASTVTTPIGVIKKIDPSTTSIYVEMLNKYSFSTLGASTSISAKSSDGGSVYSIGQTRTTNMVVFIPDNTGLYTLSDTINPGSEDKAAIIISPGKGYIEGFKVENFNSSFIDVPKGRSSDHLVTDSSSIDFSELENVMYLEQDAGISASTIDISSEYINIYGDSSYVKVLFAGVTSKDYAEGTVQSWTPFENGNLVNKNTPNSIIPLLNKQSVLFITAENEPII